MSRRLWVVLLLLITWSCASSRGSAPVLPIVLSGQSNALPDHLGAALVAAYAPGVSVIAEGSQPLRAFEVGTPLWRDLSAALPRPLSAVVWWQGESDAQEGATAAAYGEALTRFLARVRATNGDPHLLIVLVEIVAYTPPLPLRDASQVRAAQEAYVRADPNSRLVNVDDLPTDGGNHLTAAGYQAAADRIVKALGNAPSGVLTLP